MESVPSTPYLEYLDKEMTIMGILSAFSVAVPSYLLTLLFGERSTLATDIGIAEGYQFAAAIAYAILAALLFYLQRSLLAFYYGQISLAESKGRPHRREVYELLDQADGWATWLRYQTGFIALTMAFLSLLLAAVQRVLPVQLPFRDCLWQLIVPFVFAFVIAAVRWIVLSKYSDKDCPFCETWNAISSALNSKF